MYPKTDFKVGDIVYVRDTSPAYTEHHIGKIVEIKNGFLRIKIYTFEPYYYEKYNVRKATKGDLIRDLCDLDLVDFIKDKGSKLTRNDLLVLLGSPADKMEE